MKYLFVGTGDFARMVLEHLAAKGLSPRAVITGADKPSGRGLRLRPTPVAEMAARLGLETLKLEKPKGPDLSTLVESLRPDFVLVCDYGQLIPGDVLSLLPGRFLNLHPSLLPCYRGAAPVRRALMEGATRTGVSLMVMNEGLDSGPVVAFRETEIHPEDDAGTLQARLARQGAILVRDSAPAYLQGRLRPRGQDPGQATYAPPIRKEELIIDWGRTAGEINNQVRALSPSPGARARLEGRWVKVLRSRMREDVEGLLPGEMVVTGGKMLVGTGKGALEVLLLQPEGRRRMEASEFLRGYRGKERNFFDTVREDGR